MTAFAALIQPWLMPAFTAWDSPVTWLEVVAFALTVAMIVGNLYVHPAAWPLAISSSGLYFLLFHDARMYGEAALQVVFIVLSGWGWWQWLQGKTHDGHRLRVRSLTPRGRWHALWVTAVAWPVLGAFLARTTDSDVPWWDALPTAGSLTGQWLLGRQYADNWLVWVAVNVVSITLFAYKGLWLTVLLYALMTAMALAGWRRWLAAQQTTEPAP